MFALFESPDWSSFKAFPELVQRDIASLLLLDSLAKASIGQELEQLSRAGPTRALATRMRADASLAGELHICLLSTAVGKLLNPVPWSSLPAERAIDCLGMLALCEFRNRDTLEGDVELRQSGYSPDPDEARTQFLVLSAVAMDLDDIEGVSRLSDGPFLQSWLQLRSALFDVNPRDVGRSASNLSVKQTKSLFQGLSPARRRLVLGLGESLARKESAKDTTSQATRDTAPFDAARHKREHPLLYVPVPSLVGLMDQAASTIKSTVSKFPLDDYELRRLTGIKQSLPSRVIVQLIEADVRALAYALVTAAAGEKEKKFLGCGVWRKMTELFQERGVGDFQVMAEVQATGLLGEPGPARDVSLALRARAETRFISHGWA